MPVYFYNGLPLIRDGAVALDEACCCVGECCCGPCVRFRWVIQNVSPLSTCTGCNDVNSTGGWVTGDIFPTISDGVCVYEADLTPDPNPLDGCEDPVFNLKATITCPVDGQIRIESSVQIGTIVVPSPEPGEPAIPPDPHFVLDELIEDCDDYSQGLDRSGTLSNICDISTATVTLFIEPCTEPDPGLLQPASATASSQVEGTLSASAAAAGGATATSILTGRLDGDFSIQGSATAASFVEGSLISVISGAGEAVATSVLTGQISFLFCDQLVWDDSPVLWEDTPTFWTESLANLLLWETDKVVWSTCLIGWSGSDDLQGQSLATSQLQGTLAAFGLLQGDAEATSLTDGTLAAIGFLSGAAKATSVLTARADGDATIAGAAKATSVTAATLTAAVSAAGDVLATSATTATASAIAAASGQAIATSVTTGSLTELATLSGSASATSQVDGSLSATASASGAAKAASVLTGRLDGDATLQGLATAASFVDGTIAARAFAQSSVSAASVVEGTATAIVSAAGEATATSVTTGDLKATAFAAGDVSATSLLSGSVSAILAASGGASAASETTADLTARAFAAGQAKAASFLTGRLDGDATLEGQAKATSETTASITARAFAAGEAFATSVTTANLVARAFATGEASATSVAAAILSARGAMVGEAEATSVVTGALESCCCGDCIRFRYTISGLANDACDDCNDYNTDNDSPDVNPSGECVYAAQWESSDCDGQKLVFQAELICDDNGDIRLSGQIQDTAIVEPLIDPPNGPDPTNDIMSGTDTFTLGTPCSELEITLARDTGSQTTCDFDNATVVLKVIDCPSNQAVIEKVRRKARRRKARKARKAQPLPVVCQHRGELLGDADCGCAGKPKVYHCTLLGKPCTPKSVGKPITRIKGGPRIESPQACSVCDHFAP